MQQQQQRAHPLDAADRISLWAFLGLGALGAASGVAVSVARIAEAVSTGEVAVKPEILEATPQTLSDGVAATVESVTLTFMTAVETVAGIGSGTGTSTSTSTSTGTGTGSGTDSFDGGHGWAGLSKLTPAVSFSILPRVFFATVGAITAHAFAVGAKLHRETEGLI